MVECWNRNLAPQDDCWMWRKVAKLDATEACSGPSKDGHNGCHSDDNPTIHSYPTPRYAPFLDAGTLISLISPP